MIRDIGGGTEIIFWVQPRSSKNKIVGIHGDAVKIAITAPPVDGKANAAIIKFLSKLFGVSKSSVEIISGDTGRNKRVVVAGLTPDEVREKMNLTAG